jgi:methyltransferase OMS1
MIRNKFILIANGLFIYSTAAYIGYIGYKIYVKPEPLAGSDHPKNQTDVADRYEVIASDYDEKLGWDEWLLRMGNKRQSLLQHAHGDTLEISAGTGRNLEYYNQSMIAHLVLSDLSLNMLQIARDRIPVGLNVSLHKLDARKLPLPDNSFDTVTQTFGLCSISDPISALKEMKRVVKDGGSILLLEHGKSYYDWLNSTLNKLDQDHSNTWGCHWNRDIKTLIKEAGLEISEEKRYHFGTTYWMRIQVDKTL